MRREDAVESPSVTPGRVPLHTLLDVDRLISHYRSLCETLGITMSAFLYGTNGPEPLAEGREMIWYAGAICKEVGSQENGCLNRHWKSALRAMESGNPVRGCCICGEKALLSCPIMLESNGRRWPKACLTFSLLSKTSMRPAAKLARKLSKTVRHADALRKHALQTLSPLTVSPAFEDFLTESVATISREISASYAYGRMARRTRLAEEDVKEERRRMQSLAESLGVRAFVVDRSKTIRWFAGPRDGAHNGGSPVGMKCCEFVCTEGANCDTCPAYITLETGLAQTAMRQSLSPAGERSILQLKTTPILDEAGAIAAAFVVSQEATAQVQAREDIEKYHALVDNVSDMVIMADRNGHILAANKRVSEMMGYSESELMHMNTAQLCRDYDEVQNLARQAETFGSAVGEVRMVTRKGQDLFVELSLAYSPKGRTYQGVFRDIAERKRLSEELERRTHRLENQHKKLMMATEQKAKFFTNMSHELRTPMTSIVGFTELLLEDIEDPVSPGQRELLSKVSQNAHKLLEMINDLLDLSRAESGRIETTVTAVDIGKLVEQVVANMQPLAKDKDLEVVSSAKLDSVTVYTDEQRLTQILTNLVSNAIKFTPSGVVEVYAHANNWKLEISVRDTGIGIREEDIPKIFEEFHTGQESSKRKIPGTGLGLAITSKLTQMLGGKIAVRSAVGQGSTFTVTLPNRRPKSAEFDPEVM